MSFFEYTADGHIVAEHNGRTAFDTRVPMLNLVPAGAIALSGYAISWPDLWSGTYYAQSRQTSGISEFHGCTTWIALVEQEWGPAEPAPNNLPDIVLGSVPAGTDYLEIWVRLTRTQVPAKMLDLSLASNFPEGAWVKLDGYSCVVEELMGVARQFEFVLSGTTVLLRRYQSVNKNGGVLPNYMRFNGAEGIGNRGYFYAGPNAPEDVSKMLIHGQKIDDKRSLNAPTHRPADKTAGSSNNDPCSMSHAGISYASTWSGDILIKPGRISAA